MPEKWMKKTRFDIWAFRRLLMEQLSYEVVSFFVRRDEGEILDSFGDVGFTIEPVAVRMDAFRKDIEKETP
jgi:hypothetical protein